MPSFGDAFEALRRLGLRPSLHYAAYQAKLRSGWFRLRTPAGAWRAPASVELAHAGSGTFPFASGEALRSALDSLPESTGRQAIEAGEAVLRGRFDVFGRQSVEVGFPPDWMAFLRLLPDSPPPIRAGAHWSTYRLEDLSGDVKLVLELSRFGWVFSLGRAYVFSGEDRFAAAFWALLASWRQANAPNLGPQWISGQEVALRLMALIYAWQTFSPWLSKQADGLQVLRETIQVHAERIPPSLNYALAQDNNHLLVEAAALYAAGQAFPELGGAEAWRSTGRRLLTDAVARQFFEDGGYTQHSVNYARVALEGALWAAVAAERAGDQLPASVLDALARGGDWLEAMMIGKSGRAPNFGPNDGAQILPLTTCDYDDLRPTLDALRRLVGHTSLGEGAWSELGDWLGLPRASSIESNESRPASSAIFRQAGTFKLGQGRLQAVLRCAQFDRRPGHADQLHLDVWYAGQNLALDPGTYMYSGAPPWDNALAGSDVHNLPRIDSLPMMRRAGRFLWLAWAQGRLISRHLSTDGGVEVLVAAHDGYQGLGLSLQRTVVRLGQGALLVVDEAFGVGRHRLEVGWNLPDAGWTVDGRAMWLAESEWTCRLDLPDAPAALAVFKAGEQIVGQAVAPQPTWGWTSPTYAVKNACLRTLSSLQGNLPLRLMTWFEWDTGTRGSANLAWRPPEVGQAPLSHVGLGGETVEL